MPKIAEEIQTLKEEIEKIKIRNRRVEADKAWETSRARTLFITSVIYILAVILMVINGIINPFLNAAVPAIAYLVSTSTYSILKNWWLKKQKQ